MKTLLLSLLLLTTGLGRAQVTGNEWIRIGDGFYYGSIVQLTDTNPDLPPGGVACENSFSQVWRSDTGGSFLEAPLWTGCQVDKAWLAIRSLDAFGDRLQHELAAKLTTPAGTADQVLDGQGIPKTLPSVLRTQLTTDGAGQATWTFPSAFAASPIVVATPADDAPDTAVDVKITAVSGTSVTVQVNKITAAGLAPGPVGATAVHLVAFAP